MAESAQRATIVLEHFSASEDEAEVEQPVEDSWNVVAYLTLDSGRRLRATLKRCNSRNDATVKLDEIWRSLGK